MVIPFLEREILQGKFFLRTLWYGADIASGTVFQVHPHIKVINTVLGTSVSYEFLSHNFSCGETLTNDWGLGSFLLYSIIITLVF